ncbi:hypothetical protein BKA70DRAFT_1427142 [Coprinopsis sp. MPI-PUGE-AT-0042]|nr:hypothetical protein BKA70DRAFT_1427142 [Coprinopsis sp. MPI-PUGE-AT-0042]
MSTEESRETSTSDDHYPSRNVLHYLNFAVFRVQDQLYWVPKENLTMHSEVFAGMFSVENGTDGQSDENPIVLEGYKLKDFNALLRILVPKPLDSSPPQLSKEEWVSVLKLSTVWAMAIQRLSRMDLQPLDKIAMAREVCVSKWLSEGATALVETLDGFEVESVAQVLGWETTARL